MVRARNRPFALFCVHDGNLYGTTPNGGLPVFIGGCEVVYKVDRTVAETILHTFTGAPDGCGSGSLVFDEAGNLYGTSQFGGLQTLNCFIFGCGVVLSDPLQRSARST
jgi:hypothetical protein